MFFGILIFVLFGMSWFFLYFSTQISEPGPKIFFMIISLIFLIGSIGVGVVYGDSVNVTESMNNLMGAFIFVLGLILIIMFFYIIIRQIVQVMNLMRVKKGLSMGVGEYKPQGAF